MEALLAVALQAGQVLAEAGPEKRCQSRRLEGQQRPQAVVFGWRESAWYAFALEQERNWQHFWWV